MSLHLLILSILKLTQGHPLSLESLRSEVRLRQRSESFGEIDDALSALDGRGDADGVTNEDAPGGSRWAITDQGLLRLKNAGL